MKDRQTRTWLCSVVFLDIAQYTDNPVTRQVELKSNLDKRIVSAIADVSEDERIIVDTGDGAALCFLNDPEEALFASLNLRDAFLADGGEAQATMRVRIGINLGPVRFVRSIAGQLNPLGDGINNAQRIMSFAQPNQILVSRSFYDVIACLSQEYSQLFHFAGTRTDKHVREHAVYEVVVPGQSQTAKTTLLVKEFCRPENDPTDHSGRWRPPIVERLREITAEAVGPLAAVLVKKAIRRSPDGDTLLETLGEALASEQEKDAVLAKLRQTLAQERPTGGEPITLIDTPISGPVANAERRAVNVLEAAVLERAQRCLAEHLGPLAAVLVKRHAPGCKAPEELYARLAGELGQDAERESFLACARRAR